MKYIVTHPGKAHRDDMLSVAVLTCVYSNAPVYRRRPTEADLDDKEVIVVDCGGRYEPELHNFDHHQLPDHAAMCTLSLILNWIGVYDAAHALPWLRTLELMDTAGPAAVEEYYGASSFREQILPLMASPADEFLISEFSRVDEVPAVTSAGARGDDLRYHGDNLRAALAGVGRHIVDELLRMTNQLEVLNERAVLKEAHGLLVLDLTEIRQPVIGSALRHWLAQRKARPDAVLLRDPSSTHRRIIRKETDKVDLHQLSDLKRVVVKIHEAGAWARVRAHANIWRVLKRAVSRRVLCHA